MSQYFWLTGEPERALDAGQRTLALAVANADLALQVQAQLYVGRAYHAQGCYHQATEFLRQSAASLVGHLSYERFGHAGLPSVAAQTWLALSFAELGAFAKGIEHGEEGRRVAEATDQPYNLIQTYHGMGHLYLRKGDLPKAIPLLECGLRLCQVVNIPIWFPRVTIACLRKNAARFAGVAV